MSNECSIRVALEERGGETIQFQDGWNDGQEEKKKTVAWTTNGRFVRELCMPRGQPRVLPGWKEKKKRMQSARSRDRRIAISGSASGWLRLGRRGETRCRPTRSGEVQGGEDLVGPAHHRRAPRWQGRWRKDQDGSRGRGEGERRANMLNVAEAKNARGGGEAQRERGAKGGREESR